MGGESDPYVAGIQKLIDQMTTLIGEKPVLAAARQAPLKIDADGQVLAFYGSATDAADILVTQFEELVGANVTQRQLQRAAEQLPPEVQEALPARITP